MNLTDRIYMNAPRMARIQKVRMLTLHCLCDSIEHRLLEGRVVRYFTSMFIAALLLALQGCFPIVAVGVGAGALMGADRRTAGTYIEDTAIEGKASRQIFGQYKDTVHANVTSFNRHVLITGEAPSVEAKVWIEKIVASVPEVKVVSNELVIAGNSGLRSRTNDSLVTSNVKLRFIDNKNFQLHHVKVVTENGTAFLMGLVYRKEAQAAVDIASTTKGVQRVVTVFEYLD